VWERLALVQEGSRPRRCELCELVRLITTRAAPRLGEMTALAETSLADDERALVERFARELRVRLKDELHAVWLFGSRARGESASRESDVDMLVLVDDASWDGRMRVRRMLDDAAHELGVDALAWSFSVHVHTPAWLAQRREIKSFFIAELDRDKVVLDDET
jgi:predicted nucleotidyltransferase